MNWTRALLKKNAKQELKISFWKSILVCFVSGLLGGNSVFTSSGGGGSGGSRGSRSYDSGYDFFEEAYNNLRVPVKNLSVTQTSVDGEFWAMFAIVFLIVFAVILVVVICFSVFLSNPVAVGQCRFFVLAPTGNRKFGNLFSSFQGGRYWSTVKTMFTTDLYIFLWTLLLIVPGIIKWYQYRMVPYIIGDNPALTSKNARDISTAMTDGEKGDIFILDLSFIGWYILVAFVGVLIGVLAGVFLYFNMVILGLLTGLMLLAVAIFSALVLEAYKSATFAQLYYALREKYNRMMGSPSENQRYPGGTGGGQQAGGYSMGQPQQPGQQGPGNNSPRNQGPNPW